MQYRVGNVKMMQRINRLKVLNYIRQNDTVSRPEIAKITGLSPSSITNIATYLLNKKIIEEIGKVNSKEVGRKAGLIRFNPTVYQVISVDIEISRIYLALTDLAGEIIILNDIEVENSTDKSLILDITKREIGKIVDDPDRFGSSDIVSIGIAVSGDIQNEEKLIMSSTLGWKDLALKKYFEESFNIPVYIYNNSRTKAMAVLKKGIIGQDENIIFLDLTMGVGIVNIYNGRINESVVGEFGHTTVKRDGPLCFCGNRGCLEVMCTVASIIDRCNDLLAGGHCRILKSLVAREEIGAGNETNETQRLSYGSILKAHAAGDGEVTSVLRECGEYLGIGISNLINIFNPDRIIINGDILLKCDFIYRVALEEIDKRAFEHFRNNVIYAKVDISREEVIKGISYYTVDSFFSLDGPEDSF